MKIIRVPLSSSPPFSFFFSVSVFLQQSRSPLSFFFLRFSVLSFHPSFLFHSFASNQLCSLILSISLPLPFPTTFSFLVFFRSFLHLCISSMFLSSLCSSLSLILEFHRNRKTNAVSHFPPSFLLSCFRQIEFASTLLWEISKAHIFSSLSEIEICSNDEATTLHLK